MNFYYRLKRKLLIASSWSNKKPPAGGFGVLGGTGKIDLD
jgi:hypothetical protein